MTVSPYDCHAIRYNVCPHDIHSCLLGHSLCCQHVFNLARVNHQQHNNDANKHVPGDMGKYVNQTVYLALFTNPGIQFDYTTTARAWLTWNVFSIYKNPYLKQNKKVFTPPFQNTCQQLSVKTYFWVKLV